MEGFDLNHTIEVLKSVNLSQEFEAEWVKLFARCFLKSANEGRKIFQKYRCNEARFCVLRKDGQLCASYSGLILDYLGHKIFLSTDTMSDGTQRGGSILLGEHIYAELKKENVSVICGYPNAEIIGLREAKLGWTIRGGMSLYIGVPVLWRLWRRHSNASIKALWHIKRPKSGFFGKIRFGFRPLGRTKLYGNGAAVVFTLAAKLPGAFFIKAPEALVHRKTFGYRFLNEAPEFRQFFIDSITELDLETIDVP